MRVRKLIALLTVVFALVPCAGCWAHLYSKRQDQIITSARDRYKTVQPAGGRILESFDSDFEQLLAAKRRGYENIRTTLVNTIVSGSWEQLTRKMRVTAEELERDKAEAEKRVASLTEDIAALEGQRAKIAETIAGLDEAVKAAEAETSLADKLKAAKSGADAAIASIAAAAGSGANPNFKERIEASIGELQKFLDGKADEKTSKEVASLAVEAVRLGRDIAVEEQEALNQELASKNRLLVYSETQLQYSLEPEHLESMTKALPSGAEAREKIHETIERLSASVAAERGARRAGAAADAAERSALERASEAARARQTVAATLAKPGSPEAVKAEVLSRAADLSAEDAAEAVAAMSFARTAAAPSPAESTEERVVKLLEIVGLYAALDVAAGYQIDELKMRVEGEEYRNARLKDAIYERQRMTLISYGLDGTVRYAQSGIRAEDVANIIGAARAVAEFIIAARVGE